MTPFPIAKANTVCRSLDAVVLSTSHEAQKTTSSVRRHRYLWSCVVMAYALVSKRCTSCLTGKCVWLGFRGVDICCDRVDVFSCVGAAGKCRRIQRESQSQRRVNTVATRVSDVSVIGMTSTYMRGKRDTVVNVAAGLLPSRR